MTMVRLFDAFVNFEGGKVPQLFYANLAHVTEAVKTGFLIATLITCDILFVSVSCSYARPYLTHYVLDLPPLDRMGAQLLRDHSSLLFPRGPVQ